MILNHAAADTLVQWKLCPNLKFHLFKNLVKYDLKSCSCRHCGPVEAMPKFQISSSHKPRKIQNKHTMSTVTIALKWWKNCEPYWETNCRETAFHIIYKCRYFSSIRSQIFNKYTIKHNQLFSNDIGGTLLNILKFINKTKVFTKIPKWNKRDRSPNRKKVQTYHITRYNKHSQESKTINSLIHTKIQYMSFL